MGVNTIKGGSPVVDLSILFHCSEPNTTTLGLTGSSFVAEGIKEICVVVESGPGFGELGLARSERIGRSWNASLGGGGHRGDFARG